MTIDDKDREWEEVAESSPCITKEELAEAIKKAETGTQITKADTVNVATPHRRSTDETIWDTYMRIGIPAFFSLLILLLCAYKIIVDENEAPEFRAVYWSTLTATSASWIPSPSKKDK